MEFAPVDLIQLVREAGEQVDRLFTMKLPDEAVDIPGNGLGLAIVKAIVNAPQGNVAVRSEPMQGTSISVSLPTQ